jgi:hypothetical protein
MSTGPCCEGTPAAATSRGAETADAHVALPTQASAPWFGDAPGDVSCDGCSGG